VIVSPGLSAEVRRLAIPAIAHSLLQTLVFVVDRIMLGQHSDASLAAMQLGGAFEWSIWSIFSAFEVGTIARVGRHVGANEPISARRAAWISLAMALGLGSLLALATPLVLAALPYATSNVSADALEEARRYLGITVAASPIVFVSMTAIATLQAGGDTRTPLAIGIVANVIHIALNRMLILGVAGVVPALGARGAGISTALTFGLQAVLAVAALTSRTRPVSLRVPLAPALVPASERALAARSKHDDGDDDDVKTAREEARRLARIAIPAFFERVLYHIGYVGYVLIVARLGDASMAANQSLISVESICFLSADGFGIAAAALVAQKLGAKKPDDARRAAWIATKYAVIVLSAFGVGAVLLRDVILPLFSKDPGVVAIGRATVFVLAAAQPFMAIGIVLAQSLRGAGRTREALAVSVTGAVVVRLPMTWFFSMTLGMGLVGTWLGSTVDWIVRSALLLGIGLRTRARAAK
jgi:multidrug resistance protein, MATE family